MDKMQMILSFLLNGTAVDLKIVKGHTMYGQGFKLRL